MTDSQTEFNESINITDEAIRKFIQKLHDKTGKEITFKDMPHYADSDYIIYADDEVYCFVEVKVRRNKLNAYSLTEVGMRKHAVAEHYLKARKIKTWLLVVFTDCTGVLDLTEEPDKEEIHIARQDRNNYEDVYAMYKITRFYLL